MSQYTMIYKNSERMRDFSGLSIFIVVYLHWRLLDMSMR